MDCALIQIKTSVPFIYFRFLVGLSLPVLYIAVYFFAAILFDVIKRKKIQFTIILSALLYYFIFLQPDIVHQILSILSCRKVAGKDYIIADMTQLCYTSTFYQYGFSILIPLLLFFMILAPAFLYWVLKRNYYKLLDFKVRHQYGFLYKEYRQKAFYWEFVKMFEKLLIIYFLVFYSEYIKIKGILVFLAIFFYGIFQKVKQPYLFTRFNNMDYLSSMICALTILMGVFLNENKFNYFIYFGYLLIIVLNIFFIGVLVINIVKSLLADKQQLVKTVSQKLESKLKFSSKLKKIKLTRNSEQIRQYWKWVIEDLLHKHIDYQKIYQKRMVNKDKYAQEKQQINVLTQEALHRHQNKQKQVRNIVQIFPITGQDVENQGQELISKQTPEQISKQTPEQISKQNSAKQQSKADIFSRLKEANAKNVSAEKLPINEIQLEADQTQLNKSGKQPSSNSLIQNQAPSSSSYNLLQQQLKRVSQAQEQKKPAEEQKTHALSKERQKSQYELIQTPTQKESQNQLELQQFPSNNKPKLVQQQQKPAQGKDNLNAQLTHNQPNDESKPRKRTYVNPKKK